MQGDKGQKPVAKSNCSWHVALITPALATCLCLLLTSCLNYKEVALVDIANVEVEKMDAKGVYVRVDALIDNPNGYRIHVLDPDVDLFLNGKFVGKGVLDTALVLDRKSSRLYSVPMHADLQGGSLVMVMLSGALNGGKYLLGAKGTVVGKAGLIRKRFPFELEEDLEF
jgi:LEA14-like dessication related protein